MRPIAEGDTIYCGRRYPHIEAIFVFDVSQGHSSAAQRTRRFSGSAFCLGSRGMSRLVIDLLRPYRGWVAVVFAAMLIEIAASLAAPWPLKLVIDDALGNHHLPGWLDWAHEYAGFGKHTLGVALFAGVSTLAIAGFAAVASYIDNTTRPA
jgi:hypothetical protein